MPEHRDVVYVPLVDRSGRERARLKLAAVRDAPIQVLSDTEKRDFAEETIQLREGYSYEYELIGAEPQFALQDSEVITPSRLETPERIGRLEPGGNTGLLTLILEDPDARFVASGAVEVQSTKLSYRKDYRVMLDFIAQRSLDLLMKLGAPAAVRLEPSLGADAQTLTQRFAFIQSIIDSREFDEAVQRILQFPHNRLEEEESERDVRRGFRPTGKTATQVASRTPRIPVIPSHPLFGQMKALGVSAPTLPSRLVGVRRRETLDTPENRFVKYTLKAYSDFLTRMARALESAPGPAQARVQRQVVMLRDKVDSLLAHGFFTDLPELTFIPFGSPVLQRKAGYREVLRAWVNFTLSTRLVWSGGNDIFAAGKKDLAVLYEYWVFFQILELITREFRLPDVKVEDLFELGEDRISMRLRSGQGLPIEGIFHGPRPLRIQFRYNREFAATQGRRLRGSWTMPMRPDFTLSISPSALNAAEAEAQELMVHIHFDAKYRAESVEALFGTAELDLRQVRTDEGRNVYRRGDLLKMHTYRDAIRRTEGAYVLYPGTKKTEWQGFHEILPGLGAFPLRPAEDGTALGKQEISEFLHSVAEHISDRATRREQLSYHVRRVQEERAPYTTRSLVPEINPVTGTRELPPEEWLVIVAGYESEEHLTWVRSMGMYCFKVAEKAFSERISDDLASAKSMVLADFSTFRAIGLWRIKQRGPDLIMADQLRALKYPGVVVTDAVYARFEIEADPRFRLSSWNVSKLVAGSPWGNGFPIVRALDELEQAGRH